MIEPVGNRLADGDDGGKYAQSLADVGENGFAGAIRLREVHVEFAIVDALGMLVELGPAGPAADGLHLGNLHYNFLGEAPDAVGLGKADARLQDDADETVPSLKLGRNARGSISPPASAATTASAGRAMTKAGLSKAHSSPRFCAALSFRTSQVS